MQTNKKKKRLLCFYANIDEKTFTFASVWKEFSIPSLETIISHAPNSTIYMYTSKTRLTRLILLYINNVINRMMYQDKNVTKGNLSCKLIKH